MKSAFLILHDQPMVLKIVRAPLPNSTSQDTISLPERFEREIEVMKKIEHPGIVPILDGPNIRHIGRRQHLWYLEPFYSGGNLTTRLSEPWQERSSLNLLDSLAKAVEELANNNVVHRDIKPDNIVFDNADNPILIDLGIAYIQNVTPITSELSMSPRTNLYAAPEQFQIHKRNPIDFRTDLFLVGIVIFQAFTGVHPYNPADPDGYFERLMNGNWNSSALDAASPSPIFRNILRRLLEPHMSRRYRKFQHLFDSIRECE